MNAIKVTITRFSSPHILVRLTRLFQCPSLPSTSVACSSLASEWILRLQHSQGMGTSVDEVELPYVTVI